MKHRTSSQSKWKDSGTAFAPFVERGMSQAQIVNYFKLHGVPNKLDPPKPYDGFGQPVRQIRMFDMDAIRALVQVYDINKARIMARELGEI